MNAGSGLHRWKLLPVNRFQPAPLTPSPLPSGNYTMQSVGDAGLPYFSAGASCSDELLHPW